MPTYHAAFRSCPELVATINTMIVFDIRASLTDFVTVNLIEIMLFTTTTSVGATLAVALRSAAQAGVALKNGINFVDERGLVNPTVKIGLDWRTRPTLPTAYNRRYSHGADSVLADGYYRIAPMNGFRIAPGGSLVCYTLSAAVTDRNQNWHINCEVEA